MPGQDLQNALVKIHTAQTTISQFAVVIQGTAEDTVIMPTSQYQAGAIGFALQSASSGQTVPIHMGGGIGKAVAGSSVTSGSYGVVCDVSGRVQNFIATNTTRDIVCKFLRDGVAGDVVPVQLVSFNA